MAGGDSGRGQRCGAAPPASHVQLPLEGETFPAASVAAGSAERMLMSAAHSAWPRMDSFQLLLLAFRLKT